jgi:hypothetical protein
MTVKQLEILALDCFHRGDRWTDYWEQHAPAVLALDDDAARADLVGRLFSIVTSGDAPARPDEPGTPMTDGPGPDDVRTKAHYLGLQEVQQ